MVVYLQPDIDRLALCSGRRSLLQPFGASLRPEETDLKLPFAARFHVLPVRLLLFTLFGTISPMIVMIPWQPPCGNRDIAHEFRNIAIDLFLAPYMPLGNGELSEEG